VEFDVFATIWHLSWLFPVGFYYKTFLRPKWVWKLMDRVIRRTVGLGAVPINEKPANRESCHHHPDVFVAGGGVAGLSAALAAADAGQTVVLADEGAIGEKIPPGPTRAQIELLLAQVRTKPHVTILQRAPAIGIYEGPLVPVAGKDFLHLVHPGRIIVATGAVERHVVFPGNDLVGVWLGRGAARLAGVHGIPAGRTAVFAGETLESLQHLECLKRSGIETAAALVPERLVGGLPAGVRPIPNGRVIAAEGRRQVKAVMVQSDTGQERIPCDAVVLSLGVSPRDGLLRQAPGPLVTGAGEVVLPGCTIEKAVQSGRRAAIGSGDAAESALPPAEEMAGFVCTCEDVTATDLQRAWTEGFKSTELLKRYTTVTMGPCQGALCHAHLRAFVQARSGTNWTSAPTIARPPARPIRVEDAAAGLRFSIERRTALHERHVALGARMQWAGSWKRPQDYGDMLKEYWAVRGGVSLMDVGTLGKFLVTGRDATAFLERLYPCYVHDLAEGRLRYALLLNERGYLIDDGLICSLGQQGYYVTFTSAGAEQAEHWLLDWADSWGSRVRVINHTGAIGAINVAGPQARELLTRLCDDALDAKSLPYSRHREITVGGVRCRVLRVGFVGELSYELHHQRSESGRLWDTLTREGASLGIRPHGLDALLLLRLEKGHIIVGQDTDFDTTPEKIGADWAVKMEKPDFVGKIALQRLAEFPPQQKLAPIRFSGTVAPPEGAALLADGQHVGHLTSAGFSPALGYAIGLGWIRRRNGEFPTNVQAPQMNGAVVQAPFYDPEGKKLRA
jgi:sarcosine oxidase subunit alpha